MQNLLEIRARTVVRPDAVEVIPPASTQRKFGKAKNFCGFYAAFFFEGYGESNETEDNTMVDRFDSRVRAQFPTENRLIRNYQSQLFQGWGPKL